MSQKSRHYTQGDSAYGPFQSTGFSPTVTTYNSQRHVVLSMRPDVLVPRFPFRASALVSLLRSVKCIFVLVLEGAIYLVEALEDAEIHHHHRASSHDH